MISFTLMFLVCSFSNATTYYFSSSSGDDSRTSAQAQNQNTPWKSIQKLNSIFSSLQPGDNILFKKGDSFQGTLIVSKSGSSGAPITFGSYGSGQKPIITSLSTITNFYYKSGNIYEAYVNVEEDLNIVLLNGTPEAMGRFPNIDAKNKGYLTINSYGWGYVNSADLQAPTNFNGGEVVIRKNNWIIDRHSITYHSGTSIGYNTTGSYYGPNTGYGFFIQNHPGTLDQNGEWYYNPQNKLLQFYYDRGNPNSANVQVALSNQVVVINSGVSNITFSNIAILGGNENVVNITGSSNVTFDAIDLKFAGKNGINTVTTKYFTLQNSLIEDTYNSSLHMQWQDVNAKIINNTFNRNFEFAGMGINGDMNGNTIYMSGTSDNGLIENNKVTNSGYQGINFNGNNTVVKNNLVDTYCFIKDDGAGIYTHTGSSNTNYSGRKVTNNIVINGIGAVDGTKPFGPNDFAYVKGIYMDDNSSGVEIKGNTIANVPFSGIYIHNARNIDILENNTYNVGNSILFVHDYLGNVIRNVTLKNNNFLAKTSAQGHVFARSRYDDVNMMGTFDQNVYAKPIDNSNYITLDTPSKKGLIDISTWRNSYGKDWNTKNSPVAYDASKMEVDEFFLFEYNFSSSAQSIPLSGKYVDLKGTYYSGSITIPAYSSVMLLKTEAGAANQAPKVNLTGPSANSEFLEGQSISITASASDSDGSIAKVQFYNGNTLLGTDTSSPYSYSWSNVSTGSYKITAKATDNSGSVTESDAIQVNVVKASQTAPVVSITGPGDNAQFPQGESVTITANASNSDGSIAKVQFYNGNTLLGTDTSSPYSLTLSNLAVGNHTLTAKATDKAGLTNVSDAVSIKVFDKSSRYPYGGSATPIPGTVEAEDYDVGGEGVTYHDTDAANRGGSYRNDGVDISTANEGKYTIGWMDKGEWLEYTVDIASAGEYTLQTRVAAPGAGGTFHLELDGVDITGTQKVPATGGWNNYSSVTTSVTLPKGTHILRFVSDNVGVNWYWGNLNSFIFTKLNDAPTVSISSPNSSMSFTEGDDIKIIATAKDSDGSITKVQFYNGNSLLGTDTASPYNFTWSNVSAGTYEITAKATDNNGTVTVSDPVSVVVDQAVSLKSVGFPYGGTPATIPGRVETENYDTGGEGVSYHDTDSYNSGGVYRNDGVDIGHAIGGGYTIGWLNLGEWLEYTVNITSAGSYNFEALIASPATGGTFHLELDGVNITGSLKVPATGGWNNYTAVSKTGLNLPQGIHIIRFVLDSFGPSYYFGNLRAFNFTKSNEAYRILMSSNKEDITDKVSSNVESIELEVGEKIVFTADNEDDLVFDHWNIDGVNVGNQSLFEFEMPNKDITVTKHFRSFEAPEVRIILPEEKSEFEANSTVHFGIETISNDAEIEKVELLYGEKLVGELSANAKGIDWKNIPSGTHELIAKVTDSYGKAYFSNPVNIEAVDYREKDPQDILLEYAIGPNPTQDYLNVIFKNLDGIYDFEFNVVSMSGIVQKTFVARPEGSEVTLDISELKNGVYVLQLTSNGNRLSTKKFIKK